jgi:hypothetical protein
MSHPLPWRDCPHPGYRLVPARYGMKDPSTRFLSYTQESRKRLDLRGAGLPAMTEVAVCRDCGMRWYRVLRIRRGLDPFDSPFEENP